MLAQASLCDEFGHGYTPRLTVGAGSVEPTNAAYSAYGTGGRLRRDPNCVVYRGKAHGLVR